MTLMVSGCGGLAIVNAISPSSHYVKHADIRYGAHERNLLDYYEPKSAAANAPRVIFFYGGGWKDGAKHQYEFVASALTEAGFHVFIPDYRLHPLVQFPAFVDDGAEAIAWVMEHVSSDPHTSGVYLMGHSSGAHIAALLATDQQYLNRFSLAPSSIHALIGLSGPYDFLPIRSGYLTEVFPEPTRSDSQPIRFVTKRTPSTLLIHGLDDDVVEPGNARRFAAALRKSEVDVDLRLYDGSGHAAVAAALAPRLQFIADTLDDTIAFIHAQHQVQDSEGSR